jgi:hypothetical protein
MNKIGSLLSLISPVFPSILHAPIDLPSGESWVLLEPEVISCPRCDGRALITFRAENFNPMTGILVYCATETSAHRGVDLGMSFIGSANSKVKEYLLKNDISKFEKIMIGDQATKRQIREVVSPATRTPRAEIKVDPLKASVPVPDGYKNVAWLKSDEAYTIERAYQLEKDIALQTKSGEIIFRAEYYPSSSKDAQKYYANVKASRVRPLGTVRVLGWIRLEEATAVIKANKTRSDLFFDHINHGKGGKIEYFSPDSIEAKTFKSTTRLLRKK